MKAWGAPTDLEAAGQHTLLAEALLDARLHHRPQVQHTGTDLVLRAPRLLVGQHDVTDGQALAGTDVEELARRAEREDHGRALDHDTVGADRQLVDDEATTYGVVRLLHQEQALRVMGGEGHAVGMGRQATAPMKDHVRRHVEGHCCGAGEHQATGRPDLVHPVHRTVGVGGGGIFTLESQEDGLGRAVPTTGGAQRAEQLCPQPADLLDQVRLDETGGEGLRRPHGSHRVGGGRTDADGVEVECRERHQGESSATVNSDIASSSHRAT